MNLNLSKFKALESDDKKTTLMHPRGHKIIIAHKGLSPDVLKQLKDIPVPMAKGGRMSKPSQPVPDSAYPEESFTEPRDIGTGNYLSHVSKPNVSANFYPCMNPSCKSYGKEHPNCRCYGGHADGGEIDHFCAQDNEHDTSCEYYSEGGHVKGVHQSSMEERTGEWAGESKAGEHVRNSDIKRDAISKAKDEHHRVLGEMKAMPKPKIQGFSEGGKTDSEKLEDAAQEIWRGTQPVPDSPPESDPQAQPQSAQPQATPGPQMPQAVPTPLPSPDAQTAQFQPEDVNPNSEQIVAQPDAQNQTNQSTESLNPVQKFQQSKDQHMQDMYPEAQAFKADLDNGHITPETYHDLFAKKDTLGKIGTLFSLLIGSAGAGLAHQPNMLMDMMNKQIDNDLKAQQESSSNKQNFLRINQNNILNRAQASNLTADAKLKSNALAKIQMNYAALHKLVTDTNKMPQGSPQQQQAMQKLAMMNQGVQNENFNIMDRAASAGAFYNTLFDNKNSGGNTEQQFQKRQMGMQALGPEGQKISEFQTARHIPGIPGQASEPLGASEKGEIRSGMVFDGAMNDLTNWVKQHPSGALPGSPEDQRGRALAGIVQGKFREATNGGVYKSGEQDFINKLVPEDPTKTFNALRVLPRLQAVQKEMANQLDTKAKGYGFDGYPGAHKGPQQNSNPMEGKTATNSQGHKVVMRNGKWENL